MKKNTIIILVFITLISCVKTHEVSQETINNLYVYKNAKNLLIENINPINEVLNNKESHLSWRSWNSYYFENTVLPDNPQLHEIKQLWSNTYISSDKVGGLLTLRRDSLVKFVTFYENGFTSSTSHYLIYSPKEYSYSKLPNEEVITVREIEKNWYYFIIKEYKNY